MPISNDPTSLSNIALSKIGAQLITSISDNTNTSAIQCNLNFGLCYQEVARAVRWNCLLTTAVLNEVQQVGLPGTSAATSTSITATAWAPLHAYLANVYVTFGGYYYTVMFSYTSSGNFMNDLTTGALAQTDLPTSGSTFGITDGSQYPSGWGHQYLLPANYLLLATVNENVVWNADGGGGDDYEIMAGSPVYPIPNTPAPLVPCLFCDSAQVVVQYVPNQPDTTQWDANFASAFTFKLAAQVATPLRQDGGKLQIEMLQAYKQALSFAQQRNGGEQQVKRFNPVFSSLFNQARQGGANG